MSNRFDEIMNKETQERLLRIGKKMQAKSLPFLKWGDVKGVSSEITFRINGKSVLHSQWIARADEAAACYCRFSGKAEGSKLLQKGPTVVLLYSGLPSRPDSHHDRDKWLKSDYGDYRKDPWQLQYEIPLQHVETGDLALFTSSVEWGRQAIGAVIEYFANTRRRPIVQLEKREVPISGGKTLIVGALDIVSPDESDDIGVDLTKDAVVNEPATVTNGSGASKSNGGGDMDDDIPF